MRLVQLIDSQKNRSVALVQEPDLVLLKGISSTYSLAMYAIQQGIPLKTLIESNLTDVRISYDEVYNGAGNWAFLPAIDNPFDARYCMVSGTGLTHKASAENRQKMHDAESAGPLTDSMKIYKWGLEGGKPGAGKIGTQPEWFYKGNGSVLRGHNEKLSIPNFGNDGGEEPEIAAVYVNDPQGTPYRIGFTTGNEFSDHIMEKQNYLYLAPSKIRNCATGPELVLTDTLDEVMGKVSIVRNEMEVWTKAIRSGEKNMAHSLENLEYHHFKYPNHRLPNDLHIHFLGADAFSFGESVALEEGDVMVVQWEGMGRALKNTLSIESSQEQLFSIKPL